MVSVPESFDRTVSEEELIQSYRNQYGMLTTHQIVEVRDQLCEKGFNHSNAVLELETVEELLEERDLKQIAQHQERTDGYTENSLNANLALAHIYARNFYDWELGRAHLGIAGYILQILERDRVLGPDSLRSYFARICDLQGVFPSDKAFYVNQSESGMDHLVKH